MTLELYAISQPASKRPARGQEVNGVLARTHPAAGARRSRASRQVPTTNPAGAPIPFRPPLSSDAVGGWGSRSSVRKEWGHQLGGYQPGRSSPPGTSLVGTSRVAVDLLPSGRSLAGWLASLIHFSIDLLLSWLKGFGTERA